MEQKSNGLKVLDKIDTLAKCFTSDIQLRKALFAKIVEEHTEKKIEEIKQIIISSAKTYGISDYSSYTNKVEEECRKVLDIVVSPYEERVILALDIVREAISNQIIALANCNNFIYKEKKIKSGDQYKEFERSFEQYIVALENAETQSEYDKYSSLLESMENPLDFYSKRTIASIDKYAEYDQIVSESYIEVNICMKEVSERIDSLKFSEITSIATVKENIVSKILNRIKALISGKASFEKNIVDKMISSMIKTEGDYSVESEKVQDEMIKYYNAISKMLQNVKEDYELAIS